MWLVAVICFLGAIVGGIVLVFMNKSTEAEYTVTEDDSKTFTVDDLGTKSESAQFVTSVTTPVKPPRYSRPSSDRSSVASLVI